MPIQSTQGIYISMIIFQPQQTRQVYSKQHLHDDELPYFISGNKPLILSLNGHKIAPAICYESLLPEHAEQAKQAGVTIYLASVAKSLKGIKKATQYFPTMAKKHQFLVLMANCLGPSDNFIGAGCSSIWSPAGELIGQLDNCTEDVLVIDTDTHVISRILD